MNDKFVLRAENIFKSFPGTKALDNVRLAIERGEVHALLGENGAGKSTLMKILIGLLPPDSGEIYFKGQSIHFSSVHDALKAGLSMIHQELMPFPELSVAENIFMGNEPTSKFPGWLDKKKMNNDARLLMEKLGTGINITRLMKDLSVAEMQLVEIAKAISHNAQVVIMDEPTSAISEREVSILFNIIRELKDQGISVIYISHKMDEIFRIADRITIMRDGKYIGTYHRDEVDSNKLISLIVGREINAVFEKKELIPGDVLLSVQGLSGAKFRNIHFQVRKGEIVGFSGLMGSGRTEIVKALFGLEKITGGEIWLKGKKVKVRSPKKAIQLGLGLVSDDRKNYGLILKMSVKDNITLSALNRISKWFFLHYGKEKRLAAAQIEQFGIKTSSMHQQVSLLSGGNQQKVVLAKVLLNGPDIIILDDPTKGIDIGAKTEIYRLMSQLAEKGKAIIMVSSEMEEILGMSDRVVVVRNGTIKAELDKKEASQELIMKYSMS